MCPFLSSSDGRGFIKQGRGGSAGVEGGDVEGAMAGGEMEVSSAEFALVRQCFSHYKCLWYFQKHMKTSFLLECKNDSILCSWYS